ncbi:MAG: PEP-CTERM sorting domain-containing protein [Phycisphaerae bacterium]
MKRSIGVVVGMLAVLSLLGSQSASASIMAYGINSHMSGKPASSNLYIPIVSDEGEYGVGAGGAAGETKDSLWLGAGGASAGSVYLPATFGTTPLDRTKPTLLTIHGTDLDFLPQSIGSKATYREWVDIGIVFNPGKPARHLVTIDNTDYLYFRTSPGTATNNTAADYTLDLKNYLRDAAWDTINAHYGFQIEVTFHSSLQRTGGGTAYFYNTPEGFTSNFVYDVPEPATLALLLVGAPLLLRRRRTAR